MPPPGGSAATGGRSPAVRPARGWLCVDLPVTPYEEALGLQRRMVDARIDGRLDRDAVLLLEHPPVFTLGRRGGRENLTVSEDFLRESGVPVVQVERGGNITFHGPGQLVGYPVVSLRDAGIGVVDYVAGLEEVMIRVAAEWGVAAVRQPANRGVWTAGKKLGSVGITVRRGVAFHGFALNVDLPLEPFRWIHPCGLKGVRITSLAERLPGGIDMPAVRRAARKHLTSVFGVDLVPTGGDELESLLPSPGRRNPEGAH